MRDVEVRVNIRHESRYDESKRKKKKRKNIHISLLRDLERVKGYWIYAIAHKVPKICIQARRTMISRR